MVCEESVCCEARGEVPEPASYTKALKNSIKSHTFLSHGRKQTHLPFRSMDVMSAQPWDGLLRHSSVLFLTEAMMKGSTFDRVRVPQSPIMPTIACHCPLAGPSNFASLPLPLSSPPLHKHVAIGKCMTEHASSRSR